MTELNQPTPRSLLHIIIISWITLLILNGAALVLVYSALKNNPHVETPYMASLPKEKREMFVPLGSVTAKNFDWQDTGLQAYVDDSNFGSNAQVFLEASIHIPTANGRAFLRLMQDNEHIFIPGTEISAEGDKPALVTSTAFKLWSGNKLYRVQLKTSMDYEAVVDFARLRIVY